MQFLNLTLDTPAANVALDEALLEEAEAGRPPRETLRLWEPDRPFVVIGRGSRPESEVNLEYCRSRQIAVVRRASGGGAILAGPGCLMYAVVLSVEHRPELRSIDQAHRLVLDTMADALRRLTPGVQRQGTSDLAFSNGAAGTWHKFSGNSVRVKRRHVLYHGTLLYDFPLTLVAESLALAPRQPVYRAGRDHLDFVANLPATAAQLRDSVCSAWQPIAARTDWPQARVQTLLAEKYSHPDWLLA